MSSAGVSAGSTGCRCRRNRWPGVPSERPSTSLRTTSAWLVGAVPPMVNAVMSSTVGEAE